MTLDTIVFGTVTLQDLVLSFIVIFASVMIAKGISIRLKKTLKGKASEDRISVISKFVYILFITAALIVALSILDFRISGLLVAGGFLGIILGFASQSIVSNLISGIFLTFEKPFQVNDVIRLGNENGTVGMVQEIKIISTTVRTFEGVHVRIPNEKVFTGNITNFLENVARRFEYLVGIRYKDDAEEAIKVIKELIDEKPLALKNPAPQVFVEELGNSAVQLRVRVWAPSTDWFQLRMELLREIKKRLEENGIQIPFDQREVWFRNALQTEKEKKGKTK